MSRKPDPSALLLDHPVFPVAVSGSNDIEPDLNGTVAIASLSRSDRRRAALQLLAAAALAAEFDCWTGRRAVLGARARRSSSGCRVLLGCFPRPAGRLHALLGGGDRALEIERDAIIEAVAEVTALPVGDLVPDRNRGFFLEGALGRLLESFDHPIDRILGRSLWAYRWAVPELPEEGEIVYWKVADETIGRRLGGALWAALDRAGRRPVLAHNGATFRVDGSERVLVMVGRHSEDLLAGVDAWAARDGRAAVVIGAFPPGWDPPIPTTVGDGECGACLAVTGVALDTALRVIDERRGRFDPWNDADRRALTEAACRGFEPRTVSRRSGRNVDPVFRVLSLVPDGLDRNTLQDLSGVDEGVLVRKAGEGTVVVDGEHWRLPLPPRLEKDSLHRDIALSIPEDDPRRFLHLALSGGREDELLEWARSELDALRYESVREILGPVGSGVLGPAVDAVKAEAYLSGLDLSGVRTIIERMESQDAEPWRLWLEMEDHEDAWIVPDVDLRNILGRAPRVVAEFVIHRMRSAVRGGPAVSPESVTLLDRSIEHLRGDLSRWYRILRAAVGEPERFEDSEWIGDMTSGSRRLARLAAHKRALLLTLHGKEDEARRVLEELSGVVRSPGRLGSIFFDLGNVSRDPVHEVSCLLRAHRLLEAAGFRFKTRNILFNLAMVDIERLRLERASTRLRACRREKDPLHRIGEGMLAAGRGRLDELEAIAASLPKDVDEPRIREGCHLIAGLSALFDGRFGPARDELTEAGSDGGPWLDLLDGAEGKSAGARQGDDPWKVRAAASSVQAVRAGENVRTDVPEKATPGWAFRMALADAVLPNDDWMPSATREVVSRFLFDAGMDGWAERVQGRGRRDLGSFLSAADRILAAGSLQGPSASDWESLCRSLGLTGLEIRREGDGDPVWRWGDGPAKRPGRSSGAILVPLGGRPNSEAAWSLLERIIEPMVTIDDAENDGDVDNFGIAGKGPAVVRLREDIRRFAPSRLTVLLAGETGVGKGLAAEAIHVLSGRKGRFVTVNVAAVAASLFEAELYGVVKGAFTGADRDRPGLAEEADGGTLFLDEIGDLDLSLQVKLLRFLDSGEVRRVGSGRSRVVDVRVVAATHRDLEAMVEKGSFRQDLYYRMGSARILVPPLRERGEDVLILRDLFARRAVRTQNLSPVRWSREADEAFLSHRWPGNVRELSRAVEIAMLQTDSGVVRPEHLPAGLGADGAGVAVRRWDAAHRELRIELIRTALERNGGNRAATARELGLSRQTLLYHMRQLGIE